MEFIHNQDVPRGQKVTGANFVMGCRPLKSKPWRAHFVVDCDKLDYKFDAGSPTASLLKTKLLIKSAISDTRRGLRFMTPDLKDHFIASSMLDTECVCIPLNTYSSRHYEKYHF